MFSLFPRSFSSSGYFSTPPDLTVASNITLFRKQLLFKFFDLQLHVGLIWAGGLLIVFVLFLLLFVLYSWWNCSWVLLCFCFISCGERFVMEMIVYEFNAYFRAFVFTFFVVCWIEPHDVYFTVGFFVVWVLPEIHCQCRSIS